MGGCDESVLEEVLVPVGDIVLNSAGSEFVEDGGIFNIIKGTFDVEKDAAYIFALAYSVFYGVYDLT